MADGHRNPKMPSFSGGAAAEDLAEPAALRGMRRHTGKRNPDEIDPARHYCPRDYANRPSGRSRRIDTLGGALRPYVRTDAGGNPGRRFVHRVSRQMGVAGRRLDLAVTKQLADRRQALAQRQGT